MIRLAGRHGQYPFPEVKLVPPHEKLDLSHGVTGTRALAQLVTRQSTRHHRLRCLSSHPVLLKRQLLAAVIPVRKYASLIEVSQLFEGNPPLRRKLVYQLVPGHLDCP